MLLCILCHAFLSSSAAANDYINVDYLVFSCLINKKIVKKDDQCFPKPKMTSKTKYIQFTVVKKQEHIHNDEA